MVMEEYGDPWSDFRESDSEDFQPTKKKANINGDKASARPTMSHFGAPTTSNQLEKLSKGVIPKNIHTWVKKNFC